MLDKALWALFALMPVVTTCLLAEIEDAVSDPIKPASSAPRPTSRSKSAYQASKGSSPERRSSAGTADKNSASNVLYNQNCQRCHDKDGSGAKSKDSLRGIPDFRRVSWHEKRSDSELVVSILDGKGKNMPSFGDRLSKSQARELVSFLRAFNATEQQEKSSPIVPTKNSPTEFDVKFRELQEQMKELQRQFNELSSSPKKPRNR